MIRRPPRSTQSRSSAASDVYKRQPLPEESLKLALAGDAVLLGAVGGPKWEGLDYSVRPERALLGLREKLGLFANLRPVLVFDELLDASPLKKELVKGVDIMIVRELTGDVYFGRPRGVTRDEQNRRCLLYTSDAADDLPCVDLGGRRSLKKKQHIKQ